MRRGTVERSAFAQKSPVAVGIPARGYWREGGGGRKALEGKDDVRAAFPAAALGGAVHTGRDL